MRRVGDSRVPVKGLCSGAPLGNTQVFRPPEGKPKDFGSSASRRARLAFRLRPYVRKRVAQCRTVRTGPTVQLVGRSAPDGSSRLVVRGLATCGSVHSCPMCAAPIQASRAAELTTALDNHRREHAALVTLTLRHHAAMPLRLLRVILARAYTELKAGRPGAQLKTRLGYVGDVRAAEQTWGADNGWHPHLHALWFLDTAPVELESVLSEAWQRAVRLVFERLRGIARVNPSELEPDKAATFWGKVLRTAGAWYSSAKGLQRLRADLRRVGNLVGLLPDLEHGCKAEQLQTGAAGTYLAKLGLEVQGITTKTGKAGHYSSWQVAQAAAAGEQWAQRLWREHHDAMQGARSLTWSRGCREALGLEPERADETVASEPPEPDCEVLIGEIAPEEWDQRAWGAKQLLVAELHDAWERGDTLDWCQAREGPSHWVQTVAPVAPVWWTVLQREAEAMRRGSAALELPPQRDASYRYLSARERAEMLEEVRHNLELEVFSSGDGLDPAQWRPHVSQREPHCFQV